MSAQDPDEREPDERGPDERGPGERGPGARGRDDHLSSARLLACAVLAFLLVNYPLLAVFGDGGRLLGLPVLPLYVFAAWALVVALAAALTRER